MRSRRPSRDADLVGLVALLLASCTTIDLRVDDSIEAETIEALAASGGTLEDVLSAMGPPRLVGRLGDETTLLYESIELHENQFGLGLDYVTGVGHFNLLKLSLGESRAEREAALFLFDSEWRLTGVASTAWDEDFGRSGGVQLVVTIDDVVDSTALRASPWELDWGAWLLVTSEEATRLSNRPHTYLRGTRIVGAYEIDG
ncbi:MAG: hypothetical protein AAF726_22575 [Planctomycetota bacterium]